MGRRTAAIGGRRNTRGGGAPTLVGQAYPYVNGLLGSNLVEAWDSELVLPADVISAALDRFVGQKLGVVLAAAAAGNRPGYGADPTHFRGRNVVQAATSGSKSVKTLAALGFDLLPAASPFYMMTIGRMRSASASTTMATLGDNAATINAMAYLVAAGGESGLARTASVDQAIAGDATTSAVSMREVWSDANGVNVRRNMGTTHTNALGTAMTGAIRTVSLGARWGGAQATDLSVRFHLVCAAKPSELLCAQLLAYFQAESGF